jgi:Tfp pilus assembly protein PilF
MLRFAIALGLAGLTVAVYARAAGHGYVNLDDSAYVVGNALLREPLGPAAAVRHFTTPFFANWTPLTLVSYHLNHAVHGTAFAGYLWTNLVLHVTAALLLFAAFVRMTGRPWASGFVAAVFALHPLHVESVAWISSRKDVLAGCFWMAGLLAHARLAERPESRARAAAVLGCLVLGLLSKPLLVTFPFALLLLDYWPLRRLSRRALLEKLPMLAVVAVSMAITIWAQRGGGAGAFAEAVVLGLGARLANAVDSLLAYLRQSVWPAGLAVHYPHPQDGLPAARVAGAALALLALTGGALALGRRRPYLPVGWLWFLGTLVPMLGLVQVGSQARADRYTYVPLVGLAIVAAWGTPDLLTRLRAPRRLALVLGGAAVLALSAHSFQQVGVWRSSETLFAHAVAVEPDSFFGQRGLGLVRIEQGRWPEAEERLERAYRLRPDAGGPALVRLHLLRARSAGREGDETAVRARLARVLEIDPRHAGASGLLGASLVREGRYAQARPLLEQALAAPDATAASHAAMGMLALAGGDEAAAARWSREALRRDPGLAWAANNLAWVLATSAEPELRNPAEAVLVAERLPTTGPDADPNHLDTLAVAYAAAGRFAEAAAAADRGVALAESSGRPGLAASLRAQAVRYRQAGALP